MLLEKHKVMQIYERCIIPVLYIELFDLHEGASLDCYIDRCSVLSVWRLKRNLWGTVARRGTGAKMEKRGYRLTPMGRVVGPVKWTWGQNTQNDTPVVLFETQDSFKFYIDVPMLNWYFVTHVCYTWSLYDTLITYEIQIFYFQHDISLYFYAVG